MLTLEYDGKSNNPFSRKLLQQRPEALPGDSELVAAAKDALETFFATPGVDVRNVTVWFREDLEMAKIYAEVVALSGPELSRSV